MLFHMTLKYEFELYDELSMHYLVCCTYICLMQRDQINKLKAISMIVDSWMTIITVVGIVSHCFGYSSLHEAYRVIGSCSFCMFAVLSFSELLKTAIECKGIGKAMKSKDQNVDFVETNWILENAFCEYTNEYQFHAFVWHMFTCVGLFYAAQILIAHRLFMHGNDLKIRNVNVIPHVLSFVTFNLRK